MVDDHLDRKANYENCKDKFLYRLLLLEHEDFLTKKSVYMVNIQVFLLLVIYPELAVVLVVVRLIVVAQFHSQLKYPNHDLLIFVADL